MAVVTLQNADRSSLKEGAEMRDFLRTRGVIFETWPVPDSLGGLASNATLQNEEQEQVLKAYKVYLDRESTDRGYIEADMIVLNPSTPNLGDLLAKFDKVHYHDDDEVRYIFDGEGIFGFEPEEGDPFTVTVTAGDYIIVPARTCHWFTLTDKRSIKAIRLFKDTSGWVPHYRDATG